MRTEAFGSPNDWSVFGADGIEGPTSRRIPGPPNHPKYRRPEFSPSTESFFDPPPARLDASTNQPIRKPLGAIELNKRIDTLANALRRKWPIDVANRLPMYGEVADVPIDWPDSTGCQIDSAFCSPNRPVRGSLIRASARRWRRRRPLRGFDQCPSTHR